MLHYCHKAISNYGTIDLDADCILRRSPELLDSQVLPTGVFQKTLADGLAYAVNLSNVAFPTITIKESNPG